MDMRYHAIGVPHAELGLLMQDDVVGVRLPPSSFF